MEMLNKYLLCVLDVFAKYSWAKPLKDKKVKAVLNSFIEINYGLTKEKNVIIVPCKSG